MIFMYRGERYDVQPHVFTHLSTLTGPELNTAMRVYEHTRVLPPEVAAAPVEATNIDRNPNRWNSGYTPKTGSKSRKSKSAEEPMKEPTLPIIAETNDDGTKRLFKTRYNELEKLYLSTHRTLRNTKAENQELIKALGDNEVQIHKLLKQVRELESKVVDSEAVEKTIKRLAKEAQIELPTHPFAAFPLQDQIQAFFGSILCRLRLEEIPDELAE